ncbi:MAG: dihydrolipoyllysine-residue acetyltransferase [Enterobacterales bacterium]|nr:dihydrolipoyllysine-residue acetyltransferase [Enterobacterales bacterium]
MTDLIAVKVPDIGDAEGADIIEILVAVGDVIEAETPLITLETDKATMEVPSSDAGVVKSIEVKVGDQVSNGDIILQLESSAEPSVTATAETEQPVESNAESDSNTAVDQIEAEPVASEPVASEPVASASVASLSAASETQDLVVPDIGDASDVDVIEVLISSGDSIEQEQGLIVLETDKATMEVPSSFAGEVLEVSVKVGDKVSQGDVLGKIKTNVVSASANQGLLEQEPDKAAEKSASHTSIAPVKSSSRTGDRVAPVPDHPHMKKRKSEGVIHASPSVRRFARELGADLSKVSGSGPKGRILKDDVQSFIKFELSRPKPVAASGGLGLSPLPEIDHAKWGSVESKPLTRIQKISSVNLHRNWVTIPHVTQHEDADITELDAFRKSMKDEALKAGTRLTPLAFIMKGLVHTLKAFPKFNASLENDGENLTIKHYYHIGVAVETPDGLTVPVIRDVDQKGIYQLADELGEISAKARDKKLGANDMQGSSFTISSLGGIGGTAFSPIVKWPDVAILGLSRNKMQPVWNGKDFEPRLMLPMSLSYDHRVIDGADAARFVVHLAATLKDIRRVLI